MKKKREIDYIECDGCQYMLDKHEKMIKLEIPIGPRVEVFHFHSLSHPSRSDCLRYWNLNPYIIVRTLQERGYSPATIDDFLSKVSYRDKANAT